MAKDPLNKIKDEYERNARLKPALLATVPLCIVAMQFGVTVSAVVGALAGPLSAIGLTFLLSEIARDYGKRKEPSLYLRWGGKPSVAKLRHSSTLNAITRERYHAAATKLLAKSMPTTEEESADPAAADVLYEGYSNLLLEKTRDHSKFRLIFQELIRYGFRRNLWGLKPIALSIVCGCILGEIILILLALREGHPVPVTLLVAVTLDLLLLVCWIWIITPGWVRGAADAYADRLLAASEVLSTSAGRKTKNTRPSAAPPASS